MGKREREGGLGDIMTGGVGACRCFERREGGGGRCLRWRWRWRWRWDEMGPWGGGRGGSKERRGGGLVWDKVVVVVQCACDSASE